MFELFSTKRGHNSSPNNKFMTFFKLKEFADYNFVFDDNGRNCNGRKFSKRVENTAGKKEISLSDSYSNSVFKRLVLQTHKKQGFFGKGLMHMYQTRSTCF